MRWFRVRRAGIDSRHRQRFEELGLDVVRAFLTQPRGVVVCEDEGGEWTVANLREPMKPWLREQYDRAERRETWLITMEVAITILVAAELFMSVLDFYCRHPR
jgi:hypothetical protein